MISLADLQRRIDAGELTADAALAQSQAAIDAQEKDINAFVCRDQNARAANTGPLRGIAVGIKDIIDTADFPTEMGAQIYRGWQPRADAPVVMLLKQAGATIIGKTTTTAFAAHDPTPTLNPHNLDHTPGGSSSGSAAAVGAGMIPLALGTQTGGSVIRPASFCGAAAIKPSYRLLPARRREMFFVDAGYCRPVRGRSRRPCARAFGHHRPARTAAGCRDAVAADRRRDAGFRRRAGGRGRRGAADRDSGGRARRRIGSHIGVAGDHCGGLAHPSDGAGFRGASGVRLGIPRNYDAMPPLLRGRLDESKGIPPAAYDEARQFAARRGRRWQPSLKRSTCS